MATRDAVESHGTIPGAWSHQLNPAAVPLLHAAGLVPFDELDEAKGSTREVDYGARVLASWNELLAAQAAFTVALTTPAAWARPAFVSDSVFSLWMAANRAGADWWRSIVGVSPGQGE